MYHADFIHTPLLPHLIFPNPGGPQYEGPLDERVEEPAEERELLHNNTHYSKDQGSGEDQTDLP